MSWSVEELAAIKVDPILRLFAFAHLPTEKQAISKPFCDLAFELVKTVPRNAERLTSLRSLVQAKDAAVQATVPMPEGAA